MSDSNKLIEGAEGYYAKFPEPTKEILFKIRDIIFRIAPDAEEIISYNMPAFKKNKVLVYFAAYNHHIGFYPTPSGIEMFKDELSEFKVGKGSVQFPFDKPIPYDIIERIVRFRLEEDSKK